MFICADMQGSAWGDWGADIPSNQGVAGERRSLRLGWLTNPGRRTETEALHPGTESRRWQPKLGFLARDSPLALEGDPLGAGHGTGGW